MIFLEISLLLFCPEKLLFGYLVNLLFLLLNETVQYPTVTAHAELLSYRHPDEAWNETIRPFLVAARTQAWQSQLPWIVLVSHRPLAQALIARLYNEGLGGCAALHIWTPGELRRYLWQFVSEGRAIASREQLELLFRLQAGKGATPFLQSMQKDPSPCLMPRIKY